MLKEDNDIKKIKNFKDLNSSLKISVSLKNVIVLFKV